MRRKRAPAAATAAVPTVQEMRVRRAVGPRVWGEWPRVWQQLQGILLRHGARAGRVFLPHAAVAP